MGRIEKYSTYNRVRLALFTRSYACYFITRYLKVKYKIDDKLKPEELKKEYFDKRAIPEISRLSNSLRFNYGLLWKAVLFNNNPSLSQQVANKEGVRIYLAIEKELVVLGILKRNRPRDFYDPDYEQESAVLSIAIERAVGCSLKDIEDDSNFDQQLVRLQKIYLRCYYKVAHKHKLPTIRIIPFILRLIC